MRLAALTLGTLGRISMKALLAGELTEVGRDREPAKTTWILEDPQPASQGHRRSSDTNQESGSQCSCEKLEVDEYYRD